MRPEATPRSLPEVRCSTVAVPVRGKTASALLAMAVWIAAAVGAPSFAAESEVPPRTAEDDAEQAGYGHQVEHRKEQEFDPSIFTELSPVTIDETPVKLPEDQRFD